MRMDKVADPVVEAWPEEFVELYRARRTSMVRLAYLLTAGDPAAEELVQEAFLRVRSHWSEVAQPVPYLRTAVVNACRNQTRRRGIERRHDVPVETTEGPDVAVRMVIARLPERQRAVVVLRYFEDLPEAEIAAVLGCSLSAVKSLLHRTVRELREVIER